MTKDNFYKNIRSNSMNEDLLIEKYGEAAIAILKIAKTWNLSEKKIIQTLKNLDYTIYDLDDKPDGVIIINNTLYDFSLII